MRLRLKKLTVAASASLFGIGFVGVPAALAGQYDYQINGPYNVLVSRGVNHDFSYLRGSLSGASTCVERSNGTVFCGSSPTSHSYSGSCNPSACLSYYAQQNYSSAYITVHEEWR